jgi:hypothetical protein
MVTEDCANAPVAAARAANATRDFFIEISPRLNIGLRYDKLLAVTCFTFCRSPGPTPVFGKLYLLNQTQRGGAKEIPLNGTKNTIFVV